MSLVTTEFLYKNNFIVVCKAVYQSAKGKIIVHIDIGFKDHDGDIVLYNTAARYIAE